MKVINFQMQKDLKIYWNLLCNSKERFFITYEVKGNFLKKTIFRLEKRFWPVFLVLPVMLLKTQLFEKELFRPSFLVLRSIKKFSEQFITTHFVSWHFFCIIMLLFVRTYEADGVFFKKNSTFPMILTSFLSHFWVLRHQEAIPSAQKRFKQVLCKLQDHFCNNWVNVENKTFRKKVTFPVKKITSTFFLVIPSFADVHNNFMTLHKVFKQIWCKWICQLSKTW